MRSVFVAAALLPWPAWAACLPGPASFCQKLPDRSDRNTAVFLGIVRQVTTPVATRPEPTLRMEREYPTARLQVVEGFLGVEPGEFEVRLTSDHFLNGIPQQVPAFAEGELWLVEACRDPGDRQWTTSNCQRTKPTARAEEDLRVLRAWVKGQRLPARWEGEVFDPAEHKYVAGVRVYLRGEPQVISSVTDSRGRFAFENLAPGIYEASAVLPRGGAPVKVDLTQAWCARTVFLVK